MRTYNIQNIIDVNMYNSILSPDVTLENDEDGDIANEKWEKFDNKKYEAFVCERAIIELKKMLERLPEETQCTYVEGSAYIDSPAWYNYRGDIFCFQIQCDSNMSENEMQEYMSNFFLDDWDAEFPTAYNIYEYICGNCGIESFYSDKILV